MTAQGGAATARAAAVAVAVLLASCQSSPPSAVDAPLPTGAPVVDVTMTDFAFQLRRPVPAGRVVFRVRNAGRVVHRLSMLPLSEDVPPIEQQLRGTHRRAVSPFAGIYDRDPGQHGAFAVDLVRGRRYAFVCFVNGPEGSHALKGMTVEFRAGTKG